MDCRWAESNQHGGRTTAADPWTETDHGETDPAENAAGLLVDSGTAEKIYTSVDDHPPALDLFHPP
jgi:hypothetical protein